MPSPPKSPTIGIRYISDAVKSDHRLLERLYAKLTSPPSPPSPPPSPSPTTSTSTSTSTNSNSNSQGGQQRAQCSRLSWELARHLVAMELFIFPGTARRAKQGNEAAQARQRDMAQLREDLRALSAAAAAAASAPAPGGNDGKKKLSSAVEELVGHLGRHIRDVERVDLVNIENVLSGQESEDLARDFERTVFFIPHGVRDEDEGEDDGGVTAPYKSVEGLLDAGAGELRAAMEGFPRG